jgi:hypothetical protein
MNGDGLLARHASRPHQPVDGVVEAYLSARDMQCRERDDLVLIGILPALALPW